MKETLIERVYGGFFPESVFARMSEKPQGIVLAK
jgi:hypothetical protein